MNLKVCDRCGCVIKEPNYYWFKIIKGLAEKDHVQLCPNCHKDLKAFINNPNIHWKSFGKQYEERNVEEPKVETTSDLDIMRRNLIHYLIVIEAWSISEIKLIFNVDDDYLKQVALNFDIGDWL